MIVTSIFVMVWVSVNLRAYNEVLEGAEQNVKLSAQAQNLMDENIALQDEIHALKTDPRVIEREARRIGIVFEAQKVSAPAN